MPVVTVVVDDVNQTVCADAAGFQRTDVAGAGSLDQAVHNAAVSVYLRFPLPRIPQVVGLLRNPLGKVWDASR